MKMVADVPYKRYTARIVGKLQEKEQVSVGDESMYCHDSTVCVHNSRKLEIQRKYNLPRRERNKKFNASHDSPRVV